MGGIKLSQLILFKSEITPILDHDDVGSKKQYEPHFQFQGWFPHYDPPRSLSS